MNRRIWSCVLSIGLGLLLPARAATNGATTIVTNPPLPLDLTPYYHTNFFHPNYKGAGTSLARGVQKVDGVPFQVIGQAGLFGQRLAAQGTIYRDNLNDVRVGRKFEELHLVHHTFWGAEDGTAVAKLRFNYDDDSSDEITIRYGEHVRDWFRLKYEERQTPTDPGTKIFWDGQSEAAQRLSGSMRMFRTVFTNPHPEKLVRTLDFNTARAYASYSLIAATVCDTDTNRVPDKPLKLKNPDRKFDGAAKVRVLDAESGHPVPDAVIDVYVYDDSGGYPLIPYITGADGEKTIRYPTEPIRRISFTVKAKGYSSRSEQWNSVPFPAETILKLDPAMLIGGSVVNEDNQPISGARIYASSSGSSSGSSATSDASGRWSLSGVKKGMTNFSVSVTHADYPNTSFRTAASPEELTTKSNVIALADFLGQTAVLRVKRGLVLRGTVLRFDGQPATNAPVSYNRHGNTYAEKSVKTDGEGKFEFKAMAEGEYLLMITAGGCAPWWKKVQFNAGTQPLQITLEKGSVIRGVVVDKDGKPIEGAKIQNVDYSDGPPAKMNLTTDAEGKFRFGAAPPEGLQASISKEGFAKVTEHFSTGEQEQKVTLKKAGAINGTVIDADTRAAITNFTVTTGRTWGGGSSKNWQESKSYSSPEGKFTLHLEEGDQNYVLKIEAKDYFPSLSPTLKNEEEDLAIEFELRKGEGPSGIVLLPNGNPAVGASVKVLTKGDYTQLQGTAIQNYGQEGQVAQTDSEGRFKLKAAPDATGLLAIHDHGFVITSGMPTPNMTVQLQAWGRVEGLVLSGGKPKAGERLQVNAPRDGDSSILFSDTKATSDAEGRFTIERMPPGEFQIIRLIPISRNSWMHSHNTPVSVRPGETTEVILGTSGRNVTGRLQLSEPMEGVDFSRAQVSINTRTPRPPNGFKNQEEIEAWNATPAVKEAIKNRRSYGGMVNADGTFTIEDVPPGDYQINAYVRDPNSPSAFSGRHIGSMNQSIVIPEGGGPENPHPLGTLTVKVYRPPTKR